MNQQNNPLNTPTIWAIIPAAGLGRRMAVATPKQYLKLNGKTIVEHSLEQLCRCEKVAGVVVGVAENDEYWDRSGINNDKLLGTYHGGAQRIHTVLKGLEFLSKWAAKEDWVMVHDAVRPCVGLDDINLLIEQAMQFKCSAILASSVIDTVKKINSQSQIVSTLDRDDLMLALTPQLFPVKLLQQALKSSIDRNILSTDESAAVEMLGEKPLIVKGCRSNIKITTAEDLKIAKLFLNE